MPSPSNMNINENPFDNSKSPMAIANPKFFLDFKGIHEELISAKEEL